MSSSVVTVRRQVAVVVVVQVAHLQVIGAGVAGVGRVEEVVVDCDFCRHVLRPADSEGFVVLGEDAVGDGDVVGVFAEVDEAVVHAGELMLSVSDRWMVRDMEGPSPSHDRSICLIQRRLGCRPNPPFCQASRRRGECLILPSCGE